MSDDPNIEKMANSLGLNEELVQRLQELGIEQSPKQPLAVESKVKEAGRELLPNVATVQECNSSEITPASAPSCITPNKGRTR